MLASDFKLRLYEYQTFGSIFHYWRNPRKQHRHRNKRRIDGYQVYGFADTLRRQKPCIQFHRTDSRMIAQLPIELFDVDVNGINAFGALHEEKVCKTPGRR